MSEDLRRRLRAARLAQGLTQQDVADRMGLGVPARSVVCDYESGARQPVLAHAWLWAHALGLELTLRPAGGAS